MTTTEKLIAETAIDRRKAQTFEVIYDEVAKNTGNSVNDVKNTLAHLVNEGILKRCLTPVRNRMETPFAEKEPTWIWYEKGDLWPA